MASERLFSVRPEIKISGDEGVAIVWYAEHVEGHPEEHVGHAVARVVRASFEEYVKKAVTAFTERKNK
jgi:hypothetical protein